MIDHEPRDLESANGVGKNAKPFYITDVDDNQKLRLLQRGRSGRCRVDDIVSTEELESVRPRRRR
jgi:hypothetical protein